MSVSKIQMAVSYLKKLYSTYDGHIFLGLSAAIVFVLAHKFSENISKRMKMCLPNNKIKYMMYMSVYIIFLHVIGILGVMYELRRIHLMKLDRIITSVS